MYKYICLVEFLRTLLHQIQRLLLEVIRGVLMRPCAKDIELFVGPFDTHVYYVIS